MKLTPLLDFPQGLLLSHHCALDSGERKSVEVALHDGVVRVRCRVSADGELASDSVSEIRDAQAIGWDDLTFGLDLTTRAPNQRTERHRF